MEEFEKGVEMLEKALSKATDKVVSGVNRVIEEAPTELKATIQRERSKADLRSQIGTHQKTVDKAMYRLGVARFEAVVNNKQTDREEDLIEIIQTNQKLIALLTKKLEEVE